MKILANLLAASSLLLTSNLALAFEEGEPEIEIPAVGETRIDVQPTEDCGEVEAPCYLISEHGLKVLFFRHEQAVEQKELAETTLATLAQTQKDLDGLKGEMTRNAWVGAGVAVGAIALTIGAIFLFSPKEPTK